MNETPRPLLAKVGGSLLDWPGLVPALMGWVDEQHRPVALVVGGGSAADAVREFSGIHAVRDAEAHWLAIAAMELSRRMLATILPEAESVSAEDWSTCSEYPRLALLEVESLLRADEGRTLPIGWQVTSDSITAWLAHQFGLAELALLKSVGTTGHYSPEAAEVGWVDSHFETASAGLMIHWVNLRSVGVSSISTDR